MTYSISLQRLLIGLARAYDPARERHTGDWTLHTLFASIPATQWVEAA